MTKTKQLNTFPLALSSFFVLVAAFSFPVWRTELSRLLPLAEATSVPVSSLPSSALPYLDANPFALNTNLSADILTTAAPVLPERNLKLHVNLKSQQLCVEAYGDTCAKSYPVSSGASDTPTPKGEYSIHRKQELRVSNLDLPYRMPYYMAFTPDEGYGFHALPYLGSEATGSAFWHEARWHIGLPVSHGCVRLLPEDAAELFSLVEVGTPVTIE